MKVVLRDNEDDWRELEVTADDNSTGLTAYAGHSIPQWVWLDLLREAGVEVEVIHDDFGF